MGLRIGLHLRTISRMRLATCLVLFLASLSAADEVRPVAGMAIDRSCTVAPGEYALKPLAEDQPAIRILGDDLVVDFTGVTLVGSEDPTRPDLFQGRAVEVKGNNVTIRGLNARGYRIALLAENAANLKLIDCDFSYNHRPRLKSTPWREDLGDWMSFHHNEKDEWLEHSPAVYLKNCDGFVIQNLTIIGGGNGLLMTGCDNGVMHSSLVGFNSGVGVGLYRSSGNRFTMNRLDYNVRGHSEGVYNRGQDSAAFLVYEQSSHNVFDRNSATHSGDGFFLWAGQSTMDSGQGGCNDNLIALNDFSFAPTNGIEVTFSRNQIIGNTLHGCWHGIWGGYSYETLIADNDFAKNAEAINIEHGQDNTLRGNTFTGDAVGIDLYERGTPEEWAYGKARDTRSRGYRIEQNRFVNVGTGLRIRDTSDVSGNGNRLEGVATEIKIEGTEFRASDPASTQPVVKVPPPLQDAKLPEPLVSLPRERGTIRVTEWGPHDYRSPLVWPDVRHDPSGRTLLLFDPAGTNGEWLIQSQKHRDLHIEQAGSGIKRLVLSADPGKLTDLAIDLQWSGNRPIVDKFGQTVPAGQAVKLAYRRFHAPLEWDVEFFGWDETSDPRKGEAVFQTKPLAKKEVDTLDLKGQRPWAQGVPADRFATRAQTTLDAPAGEYILNVTSDDGVRVFLDDKQVFADWTHHVPKTDAIPLKLNGRHTLRVEHFEIDGYAQLRAELTRKD